MPPSLRRRAPAPAPEPPQSQIVELSSGSSGSEEDVSEEESGGERPLMVDDLSEMEQMLDAEGAEEEEEEEDSLEMSDVDPDDEEPSDLNFPPPTDLRDISNLASWTVSSAKPGCSIPQLRNPSTALFWQSDGPQPHYLNIHFFKLVRIVGLRLYLDFEADESYTPTRIQFLAGSGMNDLQEWGEMKLESPKGWVWANFDNVADPLTDSEEEEDDKDDGDDEEDEGVNGNAEQAFEAADHDASDFENAIPATNATPGAGNRDAVAPTNATATTPTVPNQNPNPNQQPQQQTPTTAQPEQFPNTTTIPPPLPRPSPRAPFNPITLSSPSTTTTTTTSSNPSNPSNPPPIHLHPHQPQQLQSQQHRQKPRIQLLGRATQKQRDRMPVLRAHLVQIKILENHQNGKDTHLRGLQVFARDKEVKAGGKVGERREREGGAVKGVCGVVGDGVGGRAVAAAAAAGGGGGRGRKGRGGRWKKRTLSEELRFFNGGGEGPNVWVQGGGLGGAGNVWLQEPTLR